MPVWAEEKNVTRTQPDDQGIFSVIYENDIFSGTDANYTNGVRFAYMSPETGMPEWINWVANHLPLLDDTGHKRVSIAAGQSLFTPDDITLADYVPGDRPYAGWLYGSIGMVSDTGRTLDNAMLTVGLIGPGAYGKNTQKFVHHLIGSPDPEGWDNQLPAEVGVNFDYERKWRKLYEFTHSGLGVDITPHVGLALGNVYTHASMGGTVRFGKDLPSDYGAPRIRPSLPGSDFFLPSADIGWYVFAGVEGRAVAYNAFLDGTMFRSSYDVDKEIFVGNAQLGAAFTYRNTRLSYTHVFNTREFDTQRSPSQFGAVSLSYRF